MFTCVLILQLSGTTPSRSLNSVSDSSLSFELPSKDKFSYEAERSDEPLSTSLSPLSEQELIEREVQCKEIVLSIRQNLLFLLMLPSEGQIEREGRSYEAERCTDEPFELDFTNGPDVSHHTVRRENI